MRKILIPTDGSAHARKALELACDLAEKHGAELLLLHVLLRDKEPHELLRLAGPDGLDDALCAALEKAAKLPTEPVDARSLMSNPNAVTHPVAGDLLHAIGQYVLDAAQRRAGERGIAARELAFGDGPAAACILERARDEGVDAIVMGTRGLREIEAITFGSVSHKVCEAASCTCIMVR